MSPGLVVVFPLAFLQLDADEVDLRAGGAVFGVRKVEVAELAGLGIAELEGVCDGDGLLPALRDDEEDAGGGCLADDALAPHLEL